MDRLGFIVKVFIASAVVAGLIKYAAPALAIPANATSSLILVLSPSLLMAAVLSWRLWQQP
ncbi:hypothetical protein [Almyronema epifaneia]|uniref:Uncharacterized protein n=1 Tax=Almyronema epifaneia S1 TaxID=2991925 RepID=A0ABW6ICX1_9CYAN